MAFNGQIAELPIGLAGLTGTHSLSQVQITQLLIAQNLTYENGTLQKEGGAVKYNDTAITGAPTILAGYDWWPNTTLQRMVLFTSTGDLLKDAGDGTFATTLASGLGTTHASRTIVPNFAEGGQEAILSDKKLFIFTAANQVQVLAADGATTADIAKPAADWTSARFPVCGAAHDNRMWAAMDHRVYFSQFTDHEDFTDTTNAGSLAIYPGEAESIVALLSFKGQLLVFKYPYGIYAIDTTDPTILNWKVTRISRPIGAAGTGCVVNLEDDVLILDPVGVFHLLSTTTEYGDYGLDSASRPALMDTYVRDNLSLSRLRNAQSVFYTAKREVHFALSHNGSGPNDARLVVDINVTGALRWRFSDRDINESLWLRKDFNSIPRLTVGDNKGFVYMMDQASRIKDGAGYTGKFQTPHMDMGHIDPRYGAMRKNGAFLEFIVEPKGNWNLYVDVYWDGKFSQTINFNMGVSGNSIGSFILDTDKLSDDTVINRKRRLTGGGRRISLVGYNSGVGEDFSVSSCYLHFTLGDERGG